MSVHLPPHPGKYRLTVGDYCRLDEAGAFGDARNELLDGDVFLMSPMHRPHSRAVSVLLVALAAALKQTAAGAEVLAGASIALPPHSMPEPDLVVTSEPYGDGIVPHDSLLLAVEVSDSTLDSDLSFKRALYASAGIPEYWVVDVQGAVIHQMWKPAGDDYAERRAVAFGDPVTAATIAGVVIDTGALLPRG